VQFTVYDKQKDFVENAVERLSRKAKLNKVPKLNFSRLERTANSGAFLNTITVGLNLLSKLDKGELDENDVEAIIAHEIGHRVDFSRKFHSANYRNTIIENVYVLFVVPLILIYFLIPPPLTILILLIWAFFMPWIIKSSRVPSELEADRNAAELLVGGQQLAISLVKITRFPKLNNVGPIGTWGFVNRELSYPSLNERLRYLNFELKKPTEIQTLSDKRTETIPNLPIQEKEKFATD
jgi:Zn-dependent protease with chaperone function